MKLIKKILSLIPCVLLSILGYYAIKILIYLISELLKAQPPTSCSFICDLISKLSSISCMKCEILAHQSLWLWIALFTLLIIGILVGIIKCAWRKLFGSKGDNNDDVNVAISGTAPLLLYAETASTGSPILVLQASGNPTGGNYQWSIISGDHKIEVQNSLNDSSLQIKPGKKSNSVGDVIVKVKYETDDGSATAQASLTVYMPSSAIKISTFHNEINGPIEFGYDHTINYRVLDQFNNRFPESFLNITEEINVLVNPYNTVFEDREFTSNENAEYGDHYILLFNGQAVPVDYIAKVQQKVSVYGIQVLDQVIVYKNNTVDFE